jgi:hypothetical protein
LKKRVLVVSLLLGLLFAASATDKATTKNKDSLMQGVWKFTTIGKQGNFETKAESLSQNFELTFHEKAVKGKAIEGEPLGFTLVSSRLSEAKTGGRVGFTTTYKTDDNILIITWHGKLSEDGNKITEGRFSFPCGAGTFTAEKQDASTETK